jgi:hypothetical protein
MVSMMFGMALVLLLNRRRGIFGVDPPRPASPRLRSPRSFWRRPAAPGFAALAIAAQFFGVDPPRPASPRLRSPLS